MGSQLEKINYTNCGRIIQHDEAIKNMILLSDKSRIATSSNDGTIKITDVNNFALLDLLNGHDKAVKYVSQFDNDTLISCSLDSCIIIWKQYKGGKFGIFNKLDRTNSSEMHRLKINKVIRVGENIASCSDDCYVKIWNTNKQGVLSLVTNLDVSEPVKSILFLDIQENKYLIVGSQKVYFYNYEDQSLLGYIDLPVEYPDALFSFIYKDMDYLAIGGDNVIYVLSFSKVSKSINVINTILGNFQGVFCFSQVISQKLNGLLFGTSNGTIYLILMEDLLWQNKDKTWDKKCIPFEPRVFPTDGVTSILNFINSNTLTVISSSERGDATKINVDLNTIIKSKTQQEKEISKFVSVMDL